MLIRRWRGVPLVLALLAGSLLGQARAFPEKPPESPTPSPSGSPEPARPLVENRVPALSPDDAPVAAPAPVLVWQGPALDAGPGGTEDAVEYGMARLFPTVAGTKPGGPKVTFGGVFQVDAGWFNQSTASQVTMGDVQDAAGIRRARLNAFGSLA